uniref:Uncharacterized protein n=1 Tax=Oryza meridionalis TaxID=40149 RepID=A0A0E0E371_9ORYZ
MDAGECSSSQPCASSLPDAAVSSDSAFPEVELAEDDDVGITGLNDLDKNNIKAILQAFSSLQRSAEEIALLESYASVKTNIGITGLNDLDKNNIKAILQAFSSLQRSAEEIALLESYASVKTNILIKAIYTVRCTTRQ